MLKPEESKAIGRGLLVLWLIWAGMLSSLLIYIFICYQFGGEIRKGVEGSGVPVGLLRNTLFGAGVVALSMAYFLRRSMLSVRAGVSKPKPIERMVQWNAPPFFARYAAAVIVSLALSEITGVYGLVLFLLGDSFQTLYTFIVGAALAMLFYRPKQEELERLAMAYKQGGAVSH